MKVKESESCSVVLDSLRPHGYTVHGILQARRLAWVACPFSLGSSQPGDQTQVSCIAGGFFTDCTTRVCALNMCETYRLRRLCRAYTEKPKFSLQCFPLFTAAAKSLQSCPTLCDSMDCSLPGSSVHGISQPRILEWVVMPSSRGSCRPRDQT